MILLGDALERLKELESESVQCCVTSPPYWGLRDYGVEGQLGLEKTPDEFVSVMVEVFREVRRVLKDNGTLWLNLGDSYAKAHEYIFLLSKSPKYLYNIDAIREPTKKGWAGSKFDTGKTATHQLGRAQKRSFHDHTDDMIVGQRIKEKSDHPLGKNKRSVWTIAPKPFKEAHFATFPPALVEPCILAGSNTGDTILDPFFGAGTVGMVAMKHQRNWIGIELNESYIAIAERRIANAKEGA